MPILKVVRAALVCLALPTLLAGMAQAQQYPSRPIKILVGFAPGGATDLIARLYALHLKEALNTPVIIENKPGASELTAIRAVLAAPADGYTLLLAAGGSLTLGPAIRKDLPYDPLKDFSHVAIVATAPGVFFVNPSVPARSIGELINYAKENPGKLNYGSAGVGSSSHLQMEYLLKVSGVSMTHIPYKATNESTQAVAGGTVHVGLAPAQPVIAMAADGRLRAIAIANTRRLPAFPNVPTMEESAPGELKGINGYTYYGLVGPARIPPEIIQKISDAVNKVSSLPDVTNRMRDGFSADPTTSSPASTRQYMEKEFFKWREVGKTLKTETSGS
jgi:tripartite-type tricarboxylate transporter receptor subunit TctC